MTPHARLSSAFARPGAGLPAEGVIAGASGALAAEVVVVGSGPGGAVTACLLAEGGRDVLLVEEGPLLAADLPAPFSLAEMVAKYRNGGVTVALGPTKIAYAEGRCVGGGSEVNSGLYHRTPGDLLERWRRDYRLDAAREDDLRPHFEACERDVSVSYLHGDPPAASLRLHEGARRLGWSSLEVPRWFLHDPARPGRGARQSMSRTYLPRALRAGARLLPDTRVGTLRRDGANWTLRGFTRPAGGPARAVEVTAGTVFVCGGATQTPALLRRSGFTRNVGDSLRMHPTVKVVARFPEPVNSAGMGVPVHQVKQFAPRFSFGCSVSTPPHLALALADHPDHLPDVGTGWPFLAAYYAMISGDGAGSLRTLPGFADPVVRYRVTGGDMAGLAEALRHLCRLLLRAGAVELFPGVAGVPPVRSEGDVERLPAPLPRSRTSLMTIHLSSSCPFGEDRRRCAVDSFGRVHGADGLYVADASLLCTQPGVNPQGSIMAFARRNAHEFLGGL